MYELKNLLINNWQLIVSVVIFILSFILQLLKKRPINNIFDWIYKFSIEAINDSEHQACYSLNKEGKSKEKLQYAISYVCEELHALFPDLHTELYEGVIAKVIEEILSTPQKKGGNKNG